LEVQSRLVTKSGGVVGRRASFRRRVVFFVIVLVCVTTLLAARPAHTGESTLVRLAAAPGPITLGNAPVRVVLSSPLDASTRQAALAKAASRGKAILRLSRLSARAQPGITYQIYFGLPELAAPDVGHAVGTVNFFNVVFLPGGKGKPDHPFDFNVARQLGSVLGQAVADLAVTVVPEGVAAPGSTPVIGAIELLGET